MQKTLNDIVQLLHEVTLLKKFSEKEHLEFDHTKATKPTTPHTFLAMTGAFFSHFFLNDIDFNQRNYLGQTLLHVLFEKNILPLLNNVPTATLSSLINIFDQSGHTVLHKAVLQHQEKNNTDIIRRFLNAGANPHLANANGDTCLHLAAKINAVDLIELFIQRSGITSIHDRNSNNDTVYDIARTLDQQETLALLTNNADEVPLASIPPLFPYNNHYWDAIQVIEFPDNPMFARWGISYVLNTQTNIKNYIESGLTLYQKDQNALDYRDLLVCLIDRNWEDLVEQVISKAPALISLDPHYDIRRSRLLYSPQHFRTPLCRAATLGFSTILKKLIDAGADCKNTIPALENAAYAGHLDCVRALLEVTKELHDHALLSVLDKIFEGAVKNRDRTPSYINIFRSILEHNKNNIESKNIKLYLGKKLAIIEKYNLGEDFKNLLLDYGAIKKTPISKKRIPIGMS
jgi:ankyrin repeat protein